LLTGEGEFWVEAFPDASTPYLIATGKVNGIERSIRAELGIKLPIPEDTLNIFGSPNAHVKMNIHEHDNASVNGEIMISGVDAGGGPDRLALGVEESISVTALIDKLGKDLKINGDLENTLLGSPQVDYTDKDGNDFTASIGQIDSLGYDANIMEASAQIFADNARALTRTTTITLTEDKDDTVFDAYKDETGTVILGGNATDVIYIDGGGNKLEIKDENNPTTIVGIGTLVVDGAKVNLHYANFDWTGDIYILGGATGKKNDAEFKIKRASVDITGDIFLLSNSDNTDGKGKVKLEFDSDTGDQDGATTISGSILAFGGTGTKSKAEIKIKRGSFNMQGFISMIGTKTKLEIKQEAGKDGGDAGDINIRGGISLLVPETENAKNEKAEIKLHARGGGEADFKIQYDSVIIKEALERLRGKLDVPDHLLQVISWEEI